MARFSPERIKVQLSVIEDAPGPRDTSMGEIHVAHVRDPDGNKLRALHVPG